MKAFRISRAPAAAGEATYDAFAKLVFEPPLESDELFDALREAYPSLKTHTERKKQAVLDFLMEERQAIEQEITAFVQQTGTPAPQTDISYSTRPSPAFSAASSLDLRKLSTSNSASSSSSSNRSAGSSPETMSLKDMTSVWTAAGHGKPKIHTRRSMTTKEKEEYRRRRQMKACKECRSRKRKCNHDPSSASSAASPHADAKVKKRTSTAAPSHPHSQQSFLSAEFDTSFLADSMSTDSPMDFLDFSPATGTEGSFDDFLLLPQDDFSSIDFSTGPLFQPVSHDFYDPFLRSQTHQQSHALSTGSRSPTSTYQSSGMSRSGSNAMTFDASQSWNFDLDPTTMDLSSQQVQHAPFATSSTDGKQAGLAAGLSPTSRRSPTQSSPTEQLLISAGELIPTPAASPGLVRSPSTSLRFTESTLRQAQSSGGRSRRETWQSAAEATTASHTLNAHTSIQLPSDLDVIPHASPDWFNDGRNDNDARRDGLVLGTDPSAAARFGEHGSSRARNLPVNGAAVKIPGELHLIPEGYNNRRHIGRSSVSESHSHEGEAPLSSRNPTSVNDPHSSNSVALATGLDNHSTPARLRQPRTTVLDRTVANGLVQEVVRDERRGGGSADVIAPATNVALWETREISNSSAEQALATSRACKGKNPDQTVASSGLEKQSKRTLSDQALVAVHTRPSSLREADGSSVNLQRRSVMTSESDVSALVFAVASVASTVLASAVSALFYYSGASRQTSSTSSRLLDNARKAMGRPSVLRQEKANIPSRATDVCVSLLTGVSRSCVFV